MIAPKDASAVEIDIHSKADVPFVSAFLGTNISEPGFTSG